MADIRFFQKLRLQETSGELHSPTPDDVLASVIDYVGKILNTRQGSNVLGDSFGIPDFTSIGVDFNLADMPRIESEIAVCVGHYEPRLSDVRVRFTPDPDEPLQMSFSLDAMISIDGTSMPITFVTRVTPAGKVTVSKW